MGSWLNMSFFQSIPSLVPWSIFRAWIVTDQFCWVSLHFNLTGGIKGREDGERGRGGTIIRGRRYTVSSSTGHLQKARNLREGLGIDSWRGRFTWKWRDEDKQSLTNFRQIRRPFGFIFQYSTPMERQEVVLSDGDGFQSTQTLFERVMAVCYIQTVITVIKNSRKTDRHKWAVLFCSKLV